MFIIIQIKVPFKRYEKQKLKLLGGVRSTKARGRPEKAFKSVLGRKVEKLAWLADKMIRQGVPKQQILKAMASVLNVSSEELMKAITIVKMHEDNQKLDSGLNQVYSFLTSAQTEYFKQMADESVPREAVLSELKKRNDELETLHERIRFLDNEVIVIESILEKQQASLLGMAFLKETLLLKFQETMNI